jgi:tryptophan synthase beta chain
LQDNLVHDKKTRVIAVEPAACPTLTRGPFAYDFGDTAQLTPLAPMHTLGHSFVPPRIHAGGLRYHGAAPLVSQLVVDEMVEARAYHQLGVFEAATTFARTEGIIPAPEPSHAVKAVVDEALACKEAGESRVILFNLCGHGLMDLSAYDAYLSGKLVDYELPEAEIQKALAEIKDLPKPV